IVFAILVTFVRSPVVWAQSPDAAAPRTEHPLFAKSAQYPVLPRALEIEPAGYTQVKTGTNAFTCIVSRRAGDLFPVCWDAEGARSLLRVDFDDAQFRLSGRSGPEVDAIIAERYKSGQYRAPARAGLAYMLSPMRYRIDEHGSVTRTPSSPHLMFYGPGLTDGDIGGARGAFVFMNRVGPDGMMIVPVGQKEREAILGESQALI